MAPTWKRNGGWPRKPISAKRGGGGGSGWQPASDAPSSPTIAPSAARLCIAAAQSGQIAVIEGVLAIAELAGHQHPAVDLEVGEVVDGQRAQHRDHALARAAAAGLQRVRA